MDETGQALFGGGLFGPRPNPSFAAISAKCCATREFGHHDHSGRRLHSGGSTTTRPLPVRTATAPGLRYRNPQIDRLASLRQMRCTSESFVPDCFFVLQDSPAFVRIRQLVL